MRKKKWPPQPHTIIDAATPGAPGVRFRKLQRKNPELLRIEVFRRDSHTESRVFSSFRREDVCTKRGCRFFGKQARQGVCHTTRTFNAGAFFAAPVNGSPDWHYVETAMRAAEREVAELRAACKSKAQWQRTVENYLISEWMHRALNIDELIVLRRENAIMRDKLARRENAKTSTKRKPV